MNLYQKLVEVRKAVDYLKKENKGHQYNYVSSSQALASVRAKMNELGLLLKPEVTSHTVTPDLVESVDKNNNPKHTITYFTELDVKYTWINADNPEEREEHDWYGQGVDIAGEKGVGKALTYAEKYFILKYFNIPTDKDDPDAFQKKGENGKKQQPRQQPQSTFDENTLNGWIGLVDAAAERAEKSPEAMAEYRDWWKANGGDVEKDCGKKGAIKVWEHFVEVGKKMKAAQEATA